MPPALLYSVDYNPTPAPLLRWLSTHLRLLEGLDKLAVSYDPDTLTGPHARPLPDGLPVTTRLPLGFALRMVARSNALVDGPGPAASPLALLVGADDQITHWPGPLRAVVRRPGVWMWRVAEGRTHLHRERPEVRRRFEAALDEALAFLVEHSGEDGRLVA